ncbi:MAG: carbohydrate ABC transporter permease [Tessaracoccus sp.]|nr:carbohydrate ABC transporter permease [Tessaracoccus sp.]
MTVVIAALFAFVPVMWLLLTAFTEDSDIFQMPPSLARDFTLDQVIQVVTNPQLTQFMLNGLFVSTATAVVSLIIGSLAGYSFSKFRYRGRSSLMYLLLIAQMVPEVLLLLTLYAAFTRVGLLNSYVGLILSYVTFTLPLSVFMMKNTFDGIPDELIESGRVDKASEWRILVRIVFPVVSTSMVAVAMFAFIRAWNDLVYSLTLMDTPKQTLPAGLTLTYLGEFQNSYGEMMAASLLSSVPVVAIFLVFQKHFVSGALAGSIK